MRTPTSLILLHASAALASAVATPHLGAAGTQYKVVAPNALAEVEGNFASGQSASSVVGVPFRQQTVYAAAEFSSLPTTNVAIVGFYGRPDHTASPRSGELGDVQIRLSTTDKGPGSLSSFFAANLGDETTTVFDGHLSLATQALGPNYGPKAFDYYYPFQTPFLYDPAAGRNLIVEIASSTGYSFVVLNDSAITWPVRSLYSFGSRNALSGMLHDNTNVVQFIFEEVSSADFNVDLRVDQEDLAIWHAGYGYLGGRAEGDADEDGRVAGGDFLAWQRDYVGGNQGSAAEWGVPEPSTAVLVLIGFCAWGHRKRPY